MQVLQRVCKQFEIPVVRVGDCPFLPNLDVGSDSLVKSRARQRRRAPSGGFVGSGRLGPPASSLELPAAGRTEASRLWRSPGPQEWQQSAPASVTGSGPIRQPLRDVHQTSVQRRLRMAPHRLSPAARRSPRRPWRRCGRDEPATVSSVSVDGSPLLPPFAAAAGARLGSLSRGAGGGLRMRPGTGHQDGRVFSCL